ncbi:hypothetical protein HanIR_Chr13g0629551 [Helianthus annuus]|nr:hypothetical protein HanIR_Chr13g0629551 [Helianthus annuus]
MRNRRPPSPPQLLRHPHHHATAVKDAAFVNSCSLSSGSTPHHHHRNKTTTVTFTFISQKNPNPTHPTTINTRQLHLEWDVAKIKPKVSYDEEDDIVSE